MIGGIGPESTIAYYRHIVTAHRARAPSGAYPRLLINSIDFGAMLARLERDDRPGLIALLRTEVESLACAGTGVALLAANTPHIVFDELQREVSIPLLSIVEATCRAALAQGLRRLALFGTRFTMQGRFYPSVLGARGIELVVPDPQEQAYITTSTCTNGFTGCLIRMCADVCSKWCSHSNNARPSTVSSSVGRSCR